MPSTIELLSSARRADLRRALHQSIEPQIQGSRARAVVRYVYERTMLMSGGLDIDSQHFFRDTINDIAEALGESKRSIERTIKQLKELGLIQSITRWVTIATETGRAPRRVNFWTLGQSTLNQLCQWLGMADDAPAVMADDQLANVAELGTANVADPNKGTLDSSALDSNSLESSSEQPKTETVDQAKPQIQNSRPKHPIIRRKPPVDQLVIADRKRAEEEHANKSFEQRRAEIAAARASAPLLQRSGAGFG